MRFMNRWATRPLGTAAVLALAMVLSPVALADTSAAVWTPKELRFTYQGFTSHYSCSGLRDRMREVLLTLGARTDLDVGPYGCTSAEGRPEPFPGVRIRMNVLTPADPNVETPVTAQWKKVDVRLETDPLEQSGSCELLEQIRQKILPQFTTRNLDFSSNCVPHQLSAGGSWLRVEVLITDQKGDKTLASK